MSFTIPPIRKRKPAQTDNPPTSSTSLVRLEDLPHQRKPYASDRIDSDLYYEESGRYTQIYDGADYAQGQQPISQDADPNFGFNGVIHSTLAGAPVQLDLRKKAQSKKARQWKTWSEDVVPSLVHPYLALLRSTDSFRLPSPLLQRRCDCTDTQRRLSIICVYFDSKSHLSLFLMLMLS